MVGAAAGRGLPVSLTTNGMAGPERYAALVEAGLREVRVSIDTGQPATFDALVGVPGASSRVLSAIAALVALARGGADLFIILNACVGAFNADDLWRTVAELQALGPDDIKLLLVSEQREQVRGRASRDLVDSLAASVAGSTSYELLPTKIRRLFRSDAFGTADPVAQRELRHCVVPLTERTQDGRFIYPCSIYVRYGGKPLASADAPLEVQQRAVNRLVRTHDCRRDPICREACTSCCRELNLEVSRRLVARQAEREGRARVVREDGLLDAAAIEALCATQRAMMAFPLAPGPPAPHVILKPSGLDWEPEIRDPTLETVPRRRRNGRGPGAPLPSPVPGPGPVPSPPPRGARVRAPTLGLSGPGPAAGASKRGAACPAGAWATLGRGAACAVGTRQTRSHRSRSWPRAVRCSSSSASASSASSCSSPKSEAPMRSPMRASA
jgi:hypothetical protein